MKNERIRRVLTLSLPIVGGMISQNVLNLVDTYMVSKLSGPALAAVGLGGFANFMCMAIILGISVGVQATAARRKGEGKMEETAAPLNAGLLIAASVGLLLSLVLYFLVPTFYPYLNNDPDVMREGIPYLQMRIIAILFVGMNFSFRGYWNAVDLPRLYMQTLIVMHISNIILNYMLIFGNWGAPEMGATGAGLGTSISTVIGTGVYFFLGFKHARKNGFLHSMPRMDEIKSLVKLSLPNSIQQLFFSSGFVASYWIIGKVGTNELAAANVLVNITMTCILPALGMGLASATLVGQALGKQDHQDAMRWGWDVVKIGCTLIGLLSLVMIFAPSILLSPFLAGEPEILEIAIWPMRIVGITITVDTMGLILMNALMGAGATKWAMRVSIIMQWGIFLPLSYLAGPILGYGLSVLWALQGGYRAVQAVIFMVLWRQGGWTKFKV